MLNKIKKTVREISTLRNLFSNESIYKLLGRDIAVEFSNNVPNGPVMVLSPHPDDETIGCAGALLKYKESEDIVTVIEFTDGSGGFPDNFRPTSSERRGMASMREQEAKKAKEALGVNEMFFLKFKDSALQASTSLINFISQKLDEFKPKVIYIPSLIDPNSDHSETARVFYLATQNKQLDLVVMQYEVWSPFYANYYLNIDREFTAKNNAIKLFASQLKSRDYAGAIEGLNKYRGMIYGKSKYAEAYIKTDLRTFQRLAKLVF